jgi:hypothetical protein
METVNSHLFGGMSLMYGRWVPEKLQVHKNLLLVGFERGDLESAAVVARVARLGPVEDDELLRDGRLVRHYYHRLAYDYQSIADPSENDLK